MSTYLTSVPVVATENLNTGSIDDGSGHQYKACDIDGTIAANAGAAGLLQNKPKSGEDATLGVQGRSRWCTFNCNHIWLYDYVCIR